MTDAELIQLLKIKLQETLDENDKLRAELARMTEGATAYATLSDIHRNRELPAAVRAKAASACLPHEMPRLESVPPAIDATCEEYIPLADLVRERRARCDQMEREARQIRGGVAQRPGAPARRRVQGQWRQQHGLSAAPVP